MTARARFFTRCLGLGALLAVIPLLNSSSLEWLDTLVKGHPKEAEGIGWLCAAVSVVSYVRQECILNRAQRPPLPDAPEVP